MYARLYNEVERFKDEDLLKEAIRGKRASILYHLHPLQSSYSSHNYFTQWFLYNPNHVMIVFDEIISNLCAHC